ncbi:YdeI/OmpD-associated family protein [Brevibacillus ginsengisoli]|uniref:YdeI/OmpD-associated family protein n=1 Tax=Brevibacillus ginsengisoli TaxID=363854 RepID=UPI003CE856BE
MKKNSSELPILFFIDQQSFENWLENNYDSSPGIRLQIAKKDSGVVSVSYEEALESSLCYGWIDSQKEKFDDKTWLQRFTPRGTKSIWSKVNREKAEFLISKGRMKPSGFKAIEAAKQSGQWDKAYESQSSASLPEDFAIELERNAKAKAFYDTLDRQNKYAILFRIHNAKKQETRTKRIEQYIAMLEKGEKIYDKKS